MGYKRFLFLFLLSFGILGISTFGILFLLRCIYEHISYDEIAKRQVRNNSIYGSSLNNNAFMYSLALIKQQKPDVIVLGTSRVAQFRKDFFNTSFVTTPNSSNTIGEMELFLERVLQIYTPKVIMLGIDPWSLTKGYKNYKYAPYQENNGEEFDILKILNGAKILYKHKKRIFEIFLNPKEDIQNPYTPYDSLGASSMATSNGSFCDGSRYYFSTFYGYSLSRDYLFQETLRQANTGSGHLVWADKIDKQRINNLEKIFASLYLKGIKVIIFFAPIAPKVYSEIEKHNERYRYLEAIREYAQKDYVFDFIDAKKLASNDCEFLDGLHGGDTTMAKILKQIGEKDLEFKKYLNLQKIDWVLNNRAGRTYSGEDFDGLKEVDFLGLGCAKK